MQFIKLWRPSVNEIVKNQILEVRDSGLTNMLDLAMVVHIAELLELDELVEFLKIDNGKSYMNFILKGKS